MRYIDHSGDDESLLFIKRKSNLSEVTCQRGVKKQNKKTTKEQQQLN